MVFFIFLRDFSSCHSLFEKPILFVKIIIFHNLGLFFLVLNTEVKVKVAQIQIIQLQGQNIKIPHRQLCRCIVRNSILPPLFVCQMIQPHARHFFDAQLFASHQSAVALDNNVLIAPDANRIIHAVLLDAAGDVVHIQLLMFSGVLVIRL